jgi:hypothetical protein
MLHQLLLFPSFADEVRNAHEDESLLGSELNQLTFFVAERFAMVPFRK